MFAGGTRGDGERAPGVIVGNRISFLRERHGMDREELAGRLDITEGFLAALERQAANPSFGLALRTCQVLESSMEEVFPYGNADVGPADHSGHPGYSRRKRTVGSSTVTSDALVSEEGTDLSPCDVTDHEVAAVESVVRYGERRGYKEGYAYHRCRESGLLFAFERISNTSSEDGEKRRAYELGAQRARHPDSPTPLLRAEALPESAAISTLSGTILSTSGWKTFSQLLRSGSFRGPETAGAADRCELCLGRGYRHPTEVHVRFWFSQVESGTDNTGVQRVSGFVVLCPRCRELGRIKGDIGGGDFERRVKHLERVNRWDTDKATKELQDAMVLSKELSKSRFYLDREAIVGEISRLAGEDHELTREARKRCHLPS